MVKVSGPLFSMTAGGTLADTLTFVKRAEGYRVETKPVPKDNRTASQASQRNLFLAAAASWQLLGSDARAVYEALAENKPLTAYSAYLRDCLRDGGTYPRWEECAVVVAIAAGGDDVAVLSGASVVAISSVQNYGLIGKVLVE